MTIHLPPHIQSSIQAAVHRGRFASLDEAMTEAASLLVQQLNQEQAQATAAASHADAGQPRKPIGEEILERTAAIPDEEFAKLPVDGAEQHDHYIYGTPCRLPPCGLTACQEPQAMVI
jgi:Arc/MetJ-type ribon-helix-helix transcriptional regulator